MTHPNENQLITAVQKASTGWKEAFNRGDAAGCAAAYEENAVMNAAPFGRYEGRAQIRDFWQHIIGEGFQDVDYIDPQIEILDSHTARLRSHWKMNKAHGVITNELWILDSDGQARLREDDFEVQG